MVYIPTDWLNDNKNMNKVHEILNNLDIDIKYEGCYTEEDAIKELEELKENIIIQKLEEGFFVFGG